MLKLDRLVTLTRLNAELAPITVNEFGEQEDALRTRPQKFGHAVRSSAVVNIFGRTGAILARICSWHHSPFGTELTSCH